MNKHPLTRPSPKAPTQRVASPSQALKMPICHRKLSHSKDGAKYYTPQPLYLNGRTYTLEMIQNITQKLLTQFFIDDEFLNRKLPVRIKEDDVENLAYKHKGNFEVLEQWTKKQADSLCDEIAKDFKCDPDALYYNYQIIFRSPKGHDFYSGLFHKDGLKDNYDKTMQLTLVLNPSEMGTIFKPLSMEGDVFENNPRKIAKGGAETYPNAQRIGIVEQADPSKFIGMIRSPLTIGHCVPANIDPHNVNPIRRPLLSIVFFAENDA